jgi:hypothetical protein
VIAPVWVTCQARHATNALTGSSPVSINSWPTLLFLPRQYLAAFHFSRNHIRSLESSTLTIKYTLTTYIMGLLGGKWGPDGAYAATSLEPNPPTGTRNDPLPVAKTDKKAKRSGRGRGNGRGNGATGLAQGAQSLSERSVYRDRAQWDSPPIEGYGESDPARLKRYDEEYSAYLARDQTQWKGLFWNTSREPCTSQQITPSPPVQTPIATAQWNNRPIEGYDATCSSRKAPENTPISNTSKTPSMPQPTPTTEAKQSQTPELQKPDVSRSSTAQPPTQIDKTSRPSSTTPSPPPIQRHTAPSPSPSALPTKTPTATTAPLSLLQTTTHDTSFRIPSQGPLSDTEFFFLLSKLCGREISAEAWEDAVRQVRDVSFGEEVVDRSVELNKGKTDIEDNDEEDEL